MYCAPADLYSFGLPHGAVPNPGRLVASVNPSTNEFLLDVHGFDANDQVQFRAEGSGSLPSPLVAGTTYYAQPLTENTFSVSATSGGATLDITTAGARVVVIAQLPVLAAIAWASRIIDDMLPAHVVPMTAPFHEIIIMTCAELAAGKLLSRSGSSTKSLGDMVDQARKRLERWSKGVPLRGDNVPTPTNLAASATVPYLDSRGWNKWGGL